MLQTSRGKGTLHRGGLQIGVAGRVCRVCRVAEGYGLFLLGPLWLAERALAAHDGHVTGLDVNRGYDVSAPQGAQFSGLALAPAAAL